jgi:hypothetical protein
VHLLGDRLLERLADELGLGRPGARQQHRELVAADASQQVGLSQPVGQRLRDGHEHAVAGARAVVVVDCAKAVDVDHDQRTDDAVAAPCRHVALELLLEAPPVEQAGERVPVDQVAQLLLDAPALRDVEAAGDHVAGHGGEPPGHAAQLAAARADREVHLEARVTARRPRQRLACGELLALRDRVQPRLALGLPGSLPMRQLAVRGEDGGQHRRGVQHGVERAWWHGHDGARGFRHDYSCVGTLRPYL